MFAAQRLRRDILRRCPRVDPLAYPPNALEPHIDALTVEIHHDRHHQACVTNLNNFAYEHPQIAAEPIAEVLGNLDNFRGT